MSRPVEIPFDDLTRLPGEGTEVWVLPSIRDQVENALDFRVGTVGKASDRTERVIVIGGGTLLDKAKAWRADHSPATRLVAIPSIWGSGAEVSPIVVANVNGRKQIRMGEQFLPDEVAYWPELVGSVPENLAVAACGDSWSHAAEAFLSPLADDGLREEIAQLISRMLSTPLGSSPEWFQLSAAACLVQARSSVGLIHGIAHTLEGRLRELHPDRGWGHAKLCSTFLAPVMAFNMQNNGKANQLLSEFAVDLDSVLQVATELHDVSAYQDALPVLNEQWRIVLRDLCTRTNVRLVRPADIDFFNSWSGDERAH